MNVSDFIKIDVRLSGWWVVAEFDGLRIMLRVGTMEKMKMFHQFLTQRLDLIFGKTT